MEGCLLATKDVSWLVSNYVLVGAAAAVVTQLLLKVVTFRPLLNLNAIWAYLAVFQAVRFVTFGWRLTTNLNRQARVKPQ